MANEQSPKTPSCPSLNRRDFLIVGAAGVAGAVAAQGLVSAAVAETKPPASGVARATDPVVDIARLDAIGPNAQIPFAYPDGDSPAVLLSLPTPAKDGVGPEGRLVAFSILCTHKGCPVNYLPERKMFVCPCHWTSFDPAKGGQIVIGQASQALPQIRLRVANGVVQAIGVEGLIYGRHTNIL